VLLPKVRRSVFATYTQAIALRHMHELRIPILGYAAVLLAVILRRPQYRKIPPSNGWGNWKIDRKEFLDESGRCLKLPQNFLRGQ